MYKSIIVFVKEGIDTLVFSEPTSQLLYFKKCSNCYEANLN